MEGGKKKIKYIQKELFFKKGEKEEEGREDKIELQNKSEDKIETNDKKMKYIENK